MGKTQTVAGRAKLVGIFRIISASSFFFKTAFRNFVSQRVSFSSSCFENSNNSVDTKRRCKADRSQLEGGSVQSVCNDGTENAFCVVAVLDLSLGLVVDGLN